MKIRQVIDTDCPDLGERIAAARKASDAPLTRLAADAGMSSANWHRIEKGDAKTVPLDTVRAMEAALGVDLGIDITPVPQTTGKTRGKGKG